MHVQKSEPTLGGFLVGGWLRLLTPDCNQLLEILLIRLVNRSYSDDNRNELVEGTCGG
jgi:hypothetical protein